MTQAETMEKLLERAVASETPVSEMAVRLVHLRTKNALPSIRKLCTLAKQCGGKELLRVANELEAAVDGKAVQS